MTAPRLAAAGAAGFILAFVACQPPPPKVPFARVTRQDIRTTIKTNGTVRPLRWTAIRAQRQGPVARLLVDQGQQVARGDVLVEVEKGSLEADLKAAEARISSAKTELDTLRAGGARAQRVAIANDLDAARLELEDARSDVPPLERLVAKNAATRFELTQAEQRIRKAENRVTALERRLESLVSAADTEAVQARLASATAEAATIRRQIERSYVRTPMKGLLYRLEAGPGAFLSTGELVAEVGVLDRLRAVIYVDEPELGGVAEGMPVEITWDAVPGKTWHGNIESLPSEIVALGTRQVGEVLAVIENAEQELPAGANINAEIQSKSANNALVVPKEALRRQGSTVGVYRLVGDHLEWRPVTIGASDLSHAEITEGLAEDDAVALPADVSLEEGLIIEPDFP